MAPVTKTIDQMAKDHNVSLRTLRFYEEKNLLHPVRVATRRLYDTREEHKLRVILAAKRLGFSLGEIIEIIATGGRRAHLRGERVDFGELLSAQVVENRLTELVHERARVCDSIAELQGALDRRASR